MFCIFFRENERDFLEPHVILLTLVIALMPSILLEQHGKKVVGDLGQIGKKTCILHLFIEQIFRILQIVHGFSKGKTRVNLEISTFAMLQRVMTLRRTC